MNWLAFGKRSRVAEANACWVGCRAIWQPEFMVSEFNPDTTLLDHNVGSLLPANY